VRRQSQAAAALSILVHADPKRCRAPVATALQKGTLSNLRPYFSDNKAWVEGDVASLNEVKAMAELVLINFASAIIHSAMFPQYPVRGVEETNQVSSEAGARPGGIS
jgi:hypothetical protein